MDAWSEKQMLLLTQLSISLAALEGESLSMGDGELADCVYASREALTRARAMICATDLR